MRQTLAVTTLVLLLLPTLALAQTGRIAVSGTAGFTIPPDSVSWTVRVTADDAAKDAAIEKATAAVAETEQALKALNVTGLVISRGSSSAEPYCLGPGGEKWHRMPAMPAYGAQIAGYTGSVELRLYLAHQNRLALKNLRPVYDYIQAQKLSLSYTSWSWESLQDERASVAKQATAKAMAMAKSVAEAAGVQVRQFEYFGFAPPATVACTKTEAATPKPDERASPVPDNPGPRIMITSGHSSPRYLKPSENSASGNSATATCTVWVVATF